MASTKPLSLSKKAKDDYSVMGTNNSSIVSKRSVERLYYPEPHFFQYFVKKPQRRAPLINRGYWLRMRAIDVVVCKFLDELSAKRKVVLNLGCGYDPLAFQWISRIKRSAHNAMFIDVDFPELMEKKAETIASTPQLCELLGDPQRPQNPNGVFLRSELYYAVGCDLTDTPRLDDLLASFIDLSTCLVLCMAEVSITYMNVDAANALVAWAARQNDIQFCLLEQYLPDGADHPFAQKMIQHFGNLQTPLKNIEAYPSLLAQEQRFSEAGWTLPRARSLWDIYRDPCFVPYSEKLALNDAEPFDEWEEFVLFASHYFLLVAMRRSGTSLKALQSSNEAKRPQKAATASAATDYLLRKRLSSNPFPGRRFGAVVQPGQHADYVVHISGLGSQTRSATTDVYTFDSEKPPPDKLKKAQKPRDIEKIQLLGNFEPRMCHTASLHEDYCLLVGGRKSPREPLRDCWKLSDHWEKVDDLPLPLYRHAQTFVHLQEEANRTGITSAILVYGGVTSANVVSNKWLLWREAHGWTELAAEDPELVPRFGAVLGSRCENTGLLLGGMTQDGIICDDHWEWIINTDEADYSISWTKLNISEDQREVPALKYLSRMGATMEVGSSGYLLMGGVSNEVIPQDYEILKIWCLHDHGEHDPWNVSPQCVGTLSPRPLLVGHSTCLVGSEVVIVGGGAVCFSFGTYLNTAPIVISDERDDDPVLLRPLLRPEISARPAKQLKVPSIGHEIRMERVPDQSIILSEDFGKIQNNGRPVVMRNLDLGPCITEWESLDTFKGRVDADREVVVHECNEAQMDFQQKNFKYVKKLFGTFIDELNDGSRLYLRSLAAETPSRKPADFDTDFPRLALDFEIPHELEHVRRSMHSSVLRVSGSVNMWLHYDVMANVLCQIRGTKRLILFPPSDVSQLGLPAGSSTSSIDCFGADFCNDASLALTHPKEAVLQPGDVLYIPPLWLHTASPTAGVSISVNIFFRSLESGYAPGRDVYGNRDLQIYEKGRQDIEKMCKPFDRLPSDMRRFYLDRLADELKEKASSSASR